MKKTLLLICLITSNLLFSQNKKELNWFDSIIGQHNLPINSGIKYKELHRTLDNNHHFFIDKQFHNETIILEGETYFNVSVKYDTFYDDLLINIPTKNESYLVIIDKKKVNSFTFLGKKFIYNNTLGFVEEVEKNIKYSIYKKHYKTSSKKIKGKSSFSVFKSKEKYYFLYKNNLTEISNRSSISKIIPSKKTEIKSFFKRNKELFKSSKDRFYKKLFKNISPNI